jgi:predicted Na+-dependent transporter
LEYASVGSFCAVTRQGLFRQHVRFEPDERKIDPLLAPLLAGMALMHFAPGFSTKVRRPLNVAGNVVLPVVLIAPLIKMGPALESVSPWVAIAALALAAGCVSAARLLIPSVPTLAFSNVNRHVGLALLLCGAHFRNAQQMLPAIAAYAIAAPLVMALYAKWMGRSPTSMARSQG